MTMRPDSDRQDSDRLEPLVERELRELYAPPRDPRYWDRLETRIMWQVAAKAAAAEDWASELGGWSRMGLAAAALVAIMLGVLAWHQQTGEAQLAYETVFESTAPMAVQLAPRRIDTTAPDEAAFLYVVGGH
jgi:hypothetical protein